MSRIPHLLWPKLLSSAGRPSPFFRHRALEHRRVWGKFRVRVRVDFEGSSSFLLDSCFKDQLGCLVLE